MRLPVAASISVSCDPTSWTRVSRGRQHDIAFIVPDFAIAVGIG
jgi:hypothetical protein